MSGSAVPADDEHPSPREDPSAAHPDLGYDLVVGWPDRTVVFFSHSAPEQAVAVFQAAGFVPVVTSVVPEKPLEAFPLLVVDAAMLADDDAVGVVRRLLGRSPRARVLLLAGERAPQSDEWRRAVEAGVHAVLDPGDREAMRGVVRDQLRLAGTTRERVLAIGAHPDDVELGCGGTLLQHRLAGDRITILTLSHGGIGGGPERRDEATASALALGAQLLLAHLPDTRIAGGADTIRLVEDVVRVIDPTVLYVHSPHDRHQDHRAVHEAVISAARSVPHVYAYQSPSATNDFDPTVFATIDDVIDAKLDLLDLFDSQADRPYLDDDAVRAAARYWARHTYPHASYVEPFEVLRATTWSRGRPGHASDAQPRLAAGARA